MAAPHSGQVMGGLELDQAGGIGHGVDQEGLLPATRITGVGREERGHRRVAPGGDDHVELVDQRLRHAAQLDIEPRLLGGRLHPDPVPHTEGVDEGHGAEIEDQPVALRSGHHLVKRGGLIDGAADDQGIALGVDGHASTGLHQLRSTNTLYDDAGKRSVGGCRTSINAMISERLPGARLNTRWSQDR